MLAQNYSCAICNQAFEDKRANVDHNHATGYVRGLLCAKCNQGLHYLESLGDWLVKAQEYLQKETS